MRSTQKRALSSIVNNYSASTALSSQAELSQRQLANQILSPSTLDSTAQLTAQASSLDPTVSCLSEGHTLKFDKCPSSLASEFVNQSPDKVLVITYETKNDMAKWSNEMEIERKIIVEKLKTDLTQVALEVVAQGFWADAVDPTTGKAIFGSEIESGLIIESDARFADLDDFDVEDLGCCTILKHLTYGTNSISGFVFYK